MEVSFENDFQQKIMLQTFGAGSHIAVPKDVLAWRQAWMGALKSWHSPYKALVDCTHLVISGDEVALKKELDRVVKFFEGFYLKKVSGFGFDASKGHGLLPFTVFPTEEEANQDIGIRTRIGPKGDNADFRSLIQVQNHFRQHTMEIGMGSPAVFDSKEKLAQLRDKITNNLRQWHSKWNLLFDCTNLQIAPDLKADFAAMLAYFNGLFLKKVVGYGIQPNKEQYPFELFRARHNAAARLEAEGAFSGDEADCVSRKS
jgi:hypothetical protein